MGEKGRESYCHVALCLCLDHLQKSKSFRIGSYSVPIPSINLYKLSLVTTMWNNGKNIGDQPSYEISIPFTSTGKAAFVPPEVSIPVGMTIIWFNNDNGEHSVTTLSNNTYSPPETIDSGPIVQDGGSFIHTFNPWKIYIL